MGNGVIIRQGQPVKKRTFSGTTDATGNILVAADNILVLGALEYDNKITFPFIYYANYGRYLHVMFPDGTICANTNVSGHFYYVDLE